MKRPAGGLGLAVAQVLDHDAGDLCDVPGVFVDPGDAGRVGILGFELGELVRGQASVDENVVNDAVRIGADVQPAIGAGRGLAAGQDAVQMVEDVGT